MQTSHLVRSGLAAVLLVHGWHLLPRRWLNECSSQALQLPSGWGSVPAGQGGATAQQTQVVQPREMMQGGGAYIQLPCNHYTSGKSGAKFSTSEPSAAVGVQEQHMPFAVSHTNCPQISYICQWNPHQIAPCKHQEMTRTCSWSLSGIPTMCCSRLEVTPRMPLPPPSVLE